MSRLEDDHQRIDGLSIFHRLVQCIDSYDSKPRVGTSRHPLQPFGECHSSKQTTSTENIRGKASVLVLITKDGYVLLTKRSANLRSHPGQVALPGGKQDKEDHDDNIVTALRETYEEVGLDFRKSFTVYSKHRQKTDRQCTLGNDNINDEQGRSGKAVSNTLLSDSPTSLEICILGHLPAIRSINHLLVTPVVGYTPNHTREQLDGMDVDSLSSSTSSHIQINPSEVETWFWTPLQYFATEKPIVEYDIWWHDGIFTYKHYDYKYTATKNNNNDENNMTKNGITQATTTTSFDITGLTAYVMSQLASIVYNFDGDDDDHRNGNNDNNDTDTDNSSRCMLELHGQLTRYYDYHNHYDDNNANMKTSTAEDRTSPSKRIKPTHHYSKKDQQYYVLVPPSTVPSMKTTSSDGDHETASTGPAALHQYDSYQQYVSKGKSARKKQRLMLYKGDCTITTTELEQRTVSDGNDNDDMHYLFQLSTADNRICWTFGASSEKERKAWIDRIQDVCT